MTFRIIMKNPGGELDNRSATDGRDAVQVLTQMIAECGELADGDSFVIIDEDEEQL